MKTTEPVCYKTILILNGFFVKGALKGNVNILVSNKGNKNSNVHFENQFPFATTFTNHVKVIYMYKHCRVYQSGDEAVI